jgi:uncharacterized protein with HEPN domain
MNHDEGILRHVAVYIADIESFTAGLTYEQFLSDRRTMQATCYAILNIGELVKGLSEGVTKRNESIPWKQIVGMRNRAAHGYHFLSPEVVWDVVRFEIPVLKKAVSAEIGIMEHRE